MVFEIFYVLNISSNIYIILDVWWMIIIIMMNDIYDNW